ncbi:MAG: hypothetical protein ACC656_02370, partial [Candidatus Heimdallarchaeota archaeon]
ELNATLTASDTRFSLDFMWKRAGGEEVGLDWRKQFDEDMAEAGLPIGKSEGIPVPVSTTSTISTSDTVLPGSITATNGELRAQGFGPRKFSKRMVLETTTLPYEGGVWNPAFNLSYSTHWTEVGIDNQLENTKWISEEELEALQESTRMPRRQMTSDSGEEDLFDDLDSGSLDAVSSKRPQGGVRRRTRQIVTPAAMIHHASIIPTDMDEVSIQKAAETWSEPEKEQSDDEWVKPSEFIAKKGKPQLDKPVATTTSEDIPKRDLTPPPVTSTGSGKLDEKILDWKAPASAETGDDWVKPSEILKQKKRTTKNTQPPIPKNKEVKKKKKKKSRPPPVAPDKSSQSRKGKKSKTKDKDKKGWASWDK